MLDYDKKGLQNLFDTCNQKLGREPIYQRIITLSWNKFTNPLPGGPEKNIM